MRRADTRVRLAGTLSSICEIAVTTPFWKVTLVRPTGIRTHCVAGWPEDAARGDRAAARDPMGGSGGLWSQDGLRHVCDSGRTPKWSRRRRAVGAA